ncbi:MAG: twin-arginine translocase TatA/TatE family subunit [Thermodesulfobacteriota bacterium]
MFGLGTTELIIILVIVLVVFGAKRLPEIGAGLGKGIQNFKKSVKDSDPKEPEKLDKQPPEILPK